MGLNPVSFRGAMCVFGSEHKTGLKFFLFPRPPYKSDLFGRVPRVFPAKSQRVPTVPLRSVEVPWSREAYSCRDSRRLGRGHRRSYSPRSVTSFRGRSTGSGELSVRGSRSLAPGREVRPEGPRSGRPWEAPSSRRPSAPRRTAQAGGREWTRRRGPRRGVRGRGASGAGGLCTRAAQGSV